MAAAGLLNKNPKPSREEIVKHMDVNVCRCGTYPRIVNAIDAQLRAKGWTLASGEGDVALKGVARPGKVHRLRQMHPSLPDGRPAEMRVPPFEPLPYLVFLELPRTSAFSSFILHPSSFTR